MIQSLLVVQGFFSSIITGKFYGRSEFSGEIYIYTTHSIHEKARLTDVLAGSHFVGSQPRVNKQFGFQAR